MDSQRSNDHATRRSKSDFRILILGGGSAGLAALEALRDADLHTESAVVEPSTFSFNQRAWMQVGTEGDPKERTRSPLEDRIPEGCTWIQDHVAEIDPEHRTVTLGDGGAIGYDYLLVALGTNPNWDRIRNLKENLSNHGICSVYGYELAEQTWNMIRSFEGGRALFTAPSALYKGNGAPLYIVRRAEDLWRKTGVLDRTKIIFTTAAPVESAGTDYAELLDQAEREERIKVYGGYELVEVRPDRREALFGVTKGRSSTEDVLRYDLLHVVPPMRPPALLEKSGLAHTRGRMKGYMNVDAESLQHPRFSSIYGIGDAIGLEGEKTSERARTQAAKVVSDLERLVVEE